MIDCRHRVGKSCAIGRFGGSPTDIECIRKCDDRAIMRGDRVAIVVERRTIAAAFDVMQGGSWYWRRGCGPCEGRRRLVEELMDADIETDDGHRPRRHGAD